MSCQSEAAADLPPARARRKVYERIDSDARFAVEVRYWQGEPREKTRKYAMRSRSSSRTLRNSRRLKENERFLANCDARARARARARSPTNFTRDFSHGNIRQVSSISLSLHARSRKHSENAFIYAKCRTEGRSNELVEKLFPFFFFLSFFLFGDLFVSYSGIYIRASAPPFYKVRRRREPFLFPGKNGGRRSREIGILLRLFVPELSTVCITECVACTNTEIGIKFAFQRSLQVCPFAWCSDKDKERVCGDTRSLIIN